MILTRPARRRCAHMGGELNGPVMLLNMYRLYFAVEAEKQAGGGPQGSAQQCREQQNQSP